MGHDIRAKVGTSLAVDHQKIISALKTRLGTRSKAQLERHLNELIADVNRYWNVVQRRSREAREFLSTDQASAEKMSSDWPSYL